MQREKPALSIIIPIYNEEAILARSIESLLDRLHRELRLQGFEIILCENGSTDRTIEIARALRDECDQVRVEQLPTPSYGRALRRGIEAAAGETIIVFNADFWDLDFLRLAIERRGEYDVLIGSKNAPGADDSRSFLRRSITFSFNLLLRLLFGYRGTDTHGLKALSAERAKRLVTLCVTDAEIFDTELVLRAQRAGLRMLETPLKVQEMRPSRYGLVKRVPRTFMDLLTLVRVMYRSNRPAEFAESEFSESKP